MLPIRPSVILTRRWLRGFSTDPNSGGKKTHFGFQSVDENEKSQKVYDVFENVASRYDLMNDVMSFGIHRFWKDLFVERLHPTTNIRLLDVAGGTGDIAFRILRHIQYAQRKTVKGNVSSEAEKPSVSTNGSSWPEFDNALGQEIGTASRDGYSVTVCDINDAMLDVGRKRAKQLGMKGITWVQGDAESLPFPDESFDAYTIAFGIRNCTHIDKVLEESRRVLRPGGRFMCLEFSAVTIPVIRSVYDWYSFQIIPAMGQIFAADWKSYQYLVESIRQFPNQDEFADAIRRAGFRFVTYENMSCGVVAIHSGFKL